MTNKNDPGTVLQLQMLGPPALVWQGRDITSDLSMRQRGLLFVLALEARPVIRSRLALMLWPERPENTARANLRVALTRLRQAVPGVLTTDARGLSMAEGRCVTDLPWLTCNGNESARHGDSAQVRGPSDWPGPLLEGFDLAGSDAFAQWLCCQRERVGRTASGLLHQQLCACEEAGQHEEAIELARRLLMLDGADECAHMALMRLLTATQRRWAALEQYETCRKVLAEKLGARPSPECYALYVQIHAQAAPSPAATPLAPRTVTHVPSHPSPLPDASPGADTALIGRARELAQLAQVLSQSTSLWVTLLGPPGIGKTALARELSARLQAQGRHDLCWVDASSCGADWAQLLQRVAQSWSARGMGSSAPRRRLIVLDGVEPVPASGPMLQPSQPGWPPGLQVLATARRPLQVQGAWQMPLEELPAESARALLLRQADGEAAARDTRSVERLLHYTGGWPWAIGVAAKWMALLGAGTLVEQIDLHASRTGQPAAHAGVHWLDDACSALGTGLAFGLAGQIREAWEALPLKVKVAVQQLAGLGNPFEARLALACGSTLDDLRLLREHGWVQALSEGRLVWQVWCRDTVDSLAAVAECRSGIESPPLRRTVGHGLQSAGLTH